MRLIEGDAEIPDRTVPLSPCALAVWIPASEITLHQRTAKNLAEWRRKLGEALAAAAESEDWEFRQVFSIVHLTVGIIHQHAQNANANFATANFLLPD
jgi:hypothetical protein